MMVEDENMGVPASPSGHEASPSAADASSQSRVPNADPYAAELREMLLASVGGYERFEGGFNWRTFSPKRRAESALSDAVNTLEAAMAELHEAGTAPDVQREWLASAIKKWAAYQYAGARCANWMITGPARFPVARNEKAMRTESRRCDEYLQFACHPGEWARRKLRGQQRREAVAADAASGTEHKEKTFGGVRVILNKTLDRVQIIFPDRPSDEERRVLKSRAFRWAPSVGAWQRQLTQNGVWAAEFVMKELGLRPASAMSAQSGETEGLAPKDASAVGEAETP